MYRAYVNDTVVEIRKLPKLQCTTPIGQITGLEPSTTHCRWEPAADTVCAANRPGVEGMHILYTHPYSDATAIVPSSFEDGWRKEMDTSLRAIFKQFLTNAPCRKEWTEWNERYAPRRDGFDGCIDYMADHHFHIPLETWLTQPFVRNVSWSLATDPILKTANPRPEIFQWPQNVVVCQASVMSSMVPNPPAPRNYLHNVDDVPACDYYIRKTEPYYQWLKSRSCTIPTLQSILK